MVVCREDDNFSFEACQSFNDEATALCARIERDFLRTLMGGCSTPISALATSSNGTVIFKGNIISPDGKQKTAIEKECVTEDANTLGILAANELLSQPSGAKIVQDIRNAKK